MCPRPSLASSPPALLSCPLCGRIPWPRITVSVVEVRRLEQLRERSCCKSLGQGLFWASRLSWPDIPSLSERPCGRPVGVEADGRIPASPWTEASCTAPSVPSQLSISSVSGQTALAKLQNVTGRPIITAQLYICYPQQDKTESIDPAAPIMFLQSHCLLRSCKGS